MNPDYFVSLFSENSRKSFGSGWTWLVQATSGHNVLKIVNTAANECVLDSRVYEQKDGIKPIFCFNLQKFAFEVGFDEDPEKYLAALWKNVNWRFVRENIIEQHIGPQGNVGPQAMPLPGVQNDAPGAVGFKKPLLPYSRPDSLDPYFSEDQIRTHYSRHHLGYYNDLVKLVQGTDFQDKSLNFIVINAKGKIWEAAAQVWNHDFYWRCVSEDMNQGMDPPLEVWEWFVEHFNTWEDFKAEFTAAVMKNSNGWTWLLYDIDRNKLVIENTTGAGCPFSAPLYMKCILVCDTWEHAYYIDHKDNKAKYMEMFWKQVNWRFVADNLGIIPHEKLREEAMLNVGIHDDLYDDNEYIIDKLPEDKQKEGGNGEGTEV